MATFIGVTVPVVGLVTAGILLWGEGFHWVDLGLMTGMYLLTALGITVGYHRLFTHRAFQTIKPIKYTLGALGSMAFQGPLIQWVGMHRMHHQFSDEDGDPHSPHAPRRRFLTRVRGFWHAHIGWAFAPMPAGMERYAGDLIRDPGINLVSRLFPFWALLGFLIPAAIGFAFGGWNGAFTGFIWGGLVRIFILHHATWSVNSVCHLWGSQPYRSDDHSRNNPFVGILALGEGWHNNHHAFPSSARHGLRWWQLDISYLFIRGLELCGLAWSVRLPSAEEQTARLKTTPITEPLPKPAP